MNQHSALISSPKQVRSTNTSYYYDTKVHPIATGPRRLSTVYAAEVDRLRDLRAADIMLPIKLDFMSSAKELTRDVVAVPTKISSFETEEYGDSSTWNATLAVNVKTLCGVLFFMATIAVVGVSLGVPAMMSALALLTMFWWDSE